MQKAFNSYSQYRALESISQDRLFDTGHWRSVCDITLTLKQGRKSDDGRWVRGCQHEYNEAFRHFMKRLNNAVYGRAARRHHRRLRVIPVIEKKEFDGRWHYHAAIEPPAHIEFRDFKHLIKTCWTEIHWAYRVDLIRPNADQGWVDYMLKFSQKSGLESWSDCIDWDSLNNPIAGA